MEVVFIFFLDAKASFNVCAASKVQTAAGGSEPGAGLGSCRLWMLCTPARGYRLGRRSWQEALFCIRLRDLSSPPRLTLPCLGSFPILAQSSCIPCFSTVLRWRCSTSTPMGHHQALVQAARLSQLLEEIFDTLSNKPVLRSAS